MWSYGVRVRITLSCRLNFRYWGQLPLGSPIVPQFLRSTVKSEEILGAMSKGAYVVKWSYPHTTASFTYLLSS